MFSKYFTNYAHNYVFFGLKSQNNRSFTCTSTISPFTKTSCE